MRRTIFIAVAVLWLVFVPQGMAHAEIKPAKTPADGVARIVLELPGEESVPATRVALQLPRGVSLVKLEPVSGWKSTVRGRVVTWSGGTIDRDEVGRFVFRARMPNSPGEEIVFPTVQRYANGLIARWIGAPGSDMPAPRLTLTAAKPRPLPPPPPPPSDPPPPVPTTAAAQEDDDGSSFWLIAGGIILALGVVGTLVWRRRA